jgi:hypothetical protein
LDSSGVDAQVASFGIVPEAVDGQASDDGEAPESSVERRRTSLDPWVRVTRRHRSIRGRGMAEAMTL